MQHGKLDYGPFFILIVKEREKSYTKAKCRCSILSLVQTCAKSFRPWLTVTVAKDTKLTSHEY